MASCVQPFNDHPSLEFLSPVVNPPQLDDPVFVIPPEVFMDPRPFIGLFGLDPKTSDIHGQIWDFLAKSTKNFPVAYRLFHSGSSSKNKSLFRRQSSYSTSGVGCLKCNWIKKHTSDLPSHLVFFLDYEWQNEESDSRKKQLQTQMKEIVGARNFVVSLVLLQHQSHPPGFDMLMPTKLAQLYRDFELGPRQLFLLETSNLQDMELAISRMESVWVAVSYAKYYARETVTLADVVPAKTSTFKSVRRCFKVAYFKEIEQKFDDAEKNYRRAYDLLSQIPDDDFEIFIVSLILLIRICRLKLRVGDLEGAVAKFDAHITQFENRCLKFPYKKQAWLSRLNFAFGLLLEISPEVANQFNESVQPKVYFEKAIEFMRNRLECRKVFPPIDFGKNKTPRAEFQRSDFYGQPLLVIEGNEKTPQNHILLHVLDLEKKVDCVGWIIHYLKRIVWNSAKNGKSKNFFSACIRLSDECLNAKLFGEANMVIKEALHLSHEKDWIKEHSNLVIRYCGSSALTCNVSDFVQAALEALEPTSKLPAKSRLDMQETLNAICSRNKPNFRYLLGSRSPAVDLKWSLLSDADLTCIVDMDQIASSCIQIHCCFDSPMCQAFHPVKLLVEITISSPKPFAFTSAQLTLTSPESDADFQVAISESEFVVQPGPPMKIRRNIILDEYQVGRRFSIGKFHLGIGDYIILAWEKSHKIGSKMDDGGPFYSMEITQRTSSVDVYVAPLADITVGESFLLQVTIQNRESHTLKNAKFGIDCQAGIVNGKITFRAPVCPTPVNEISVDLPDILSGAVERFSFRLRSPSPLKTTLRAFVKYQVDQLNISDIAERRVLLEVSPENVVRRGLRSTGDLKPLDIDAIVIVVIPIDDSQTTSEIVESNTDELTHMEQDPSRNASAACIMQLSSSFINLLSNTSPVSWGEASDLNNGEVGVLPPFIVSAQKITEIHQMALDVQALCRTAAVIRAARARRNSTTPTPKTGRKKKRKTAEAPSQSGNEPDDLLLTPTVSSDPIPSTAQLDTSQQDPTHSDFSLSL